jgi:hypothetical protein
MSEKALGEDVARLLPVLGHGTRKRKRIQWRGMNEVISIPPKAGPVHTSERSTKVEREFAPATSEPAPDTTLVGAPSDSSSRSDVLDDFLKYVGRKANRRSPLDDLLTGVDSETILLQLRQWAFQWTRDLRFSSSRILGLEGLIPNESKDAGTQDAPPADLTEDHDPHVAMSRTEAISSEDEDDDSDEPRSERETMTMAAQLFGGREQRMVSVDEHDNASEDEDDHGRPQISNTHLSSSGNGSSEEEEAPDEDGESGPLSPSTPPADWTLNSPD